MGDNEEQGGDFAGFDKTRGLLESLAIIFLSLGADPIRNMRLVLDGGKEILGSDYSLYCRYQQGLYHLISTYAEEHGTTLRNGAGSLPCELISSGTEELVLVENITEQGYPLQDPLVRKYGFNSAAAQVVFLDGRAVGCICAYYEREKAFSEQEKAIMRLGAKELSIEEERAAHEKRLRDIIDIVSHELRHPITILRGYSLHLAENWGSLEREKVIGILSAIEYNSYRLEKLVNELLHTSQIERGLFAVEMRALVLNPLIEDTVRDMNENYQFDRLEVFLPDEMIPVLGDPERLSQLLVLLLENAIKYSEKDGTVRLHAAVDGGKARVSVQDEGPGIKEEDRDKIFEPFFQSERTVNHSKSGIGIGLYIAREIVNAHGGEIWCEAREEGGSTFSFSLPLHGETPGATRIELSPTE